MAEQNWQTNVANVMADVYSQVLGSAYMTEDGKLSAVKTGDLIEIGRDVLDMEQGLEKMAKALMVTVGKIVVEDFFGDNLRLKQMFTDSWEYGNIYEVVTVNPQTLIETDLYNLVDGKDYSSIENSYYKPNLTVKVFNSKRTFALAVSFASDRLRVAVQNGKELSSIISEIRSCISQQLREYWYAQALALLGVGIAISSNTTETAVHLLTEAKALGIVANEVTDGYKELNNNETFCAFVMRKIALIREQMRYRTSAFNNKTVPAATGRADLYVLNDFEKVSRFGVYRNSYHNEELDIGTYEVVPYWQAHLSADGTTDFNFTTNSSVEINDADNVLGLNSADSKVENCIAFLCDHKAIAMLNERESVESKYVSCARFWTDFYCLEITPVVNPSYSMVAFLLD